MKRIVGFFLFFFLCIHYSIGQSNPPQTFQCYFSEDTSQLENQESVGQLFSENGQLFTPKGDLKTLVVFVSFEGFELENLKQGVWPQEVGGLPNIISNPTSTNYNFHFGGEGYFFKEPSDFSDPTYMDDQSYRGISKMLYQLSKPNESFRFMVETFTDANGIPRVVDIDPDDYSGGQWLGLNQLAISRMLEINPGFDMSNFDNRQNSPNFSFDNSSTASDGVADNVVFIYRYNGNSEVSDELPGIDNWTGSGGGFYGPSGIGALSFNGVDMPNRGFTLCVGAGDTRALFLHELGHAVFNAPHIGGANSVSGNYYSFPSTGIGSTANRIPMMHPILNSWERWFLGYITPNEVSSSDGEVTINLRDHLRFGDAIRVEIPFSGEYGTEPQYLWITNHTGDNPYNSHKWLGANPGPGSITLPDIDKGVLMFVEDISGNKDDVSVFSGGNGIKFINASGNFDYVNDDSQPPVNNNWNNSMHLIERKDENPISGNSTWHKVRYDNNGNGSIGYSGGYNTGTGNEGLNINREKVNGNEYFTYRSWGVYDDQFSTEFRSPFFKQGDELKIGENPLVLNYPEFNASSETNAPYFLNGLKIEIVDVDDTNSPGDENYMLTQVKVSFKETEIQNDFRISGEVILPNISEDESSDLVVKEDQELVINLSGTNDRLTSHSETGEFINPTNFQIANGAKMELEDGATLKVKDLSNFIMKEDSYLKVGQNGVVIIEEDAAMKLQGEYTIELGLGAELRVYGALETDSDLDFKFEGMGQVVFYPSHNPNLGQNSDVVIERPPWVYRADMITLEEGTTLDLDGKLLSLRGGKVTYKANSYIDMGSGGELDISFMDFISEDNQSCIGLQGSSFESVLVNNSRFKNFLRAIQIASFNNELYFGYSKFFDNQTGLQVESGPSIEVHLCDFDNNSTVGVRANQMDEFRFKGGRVQNGGVYGVNLNSIPFAVFDKGADIQDCDNGINATRTNVFLRNCVKVRNNQVGVRFEGNNEANFSLTVGDEGKASVMNNTLYGVEGNNIILNIDVITHHGGNQASNSDHLANDFINNGQAHFKICYTDGNFVPYSIPMRINNWGGGAPSAGDIDIEYQSCNTAVLYDYMPYATQSKDCDGIDPEAEEPFISYSAEQFSGTWGPSDCECNKWLSSASAELSDQYQNGYEEIRNENYVYGQQELESVSNEVGDVQMSDICRHLSHVSYSLVKLNDTLIGDVGLRSAEDQFAISDNSADKGVKIFPNPTQDRVQIMNETNVDIILLIFDENGVLVNEGSMSSGETKVWRNMRSGMYFFRIMNSRNGEQIKEHKQVILE